MKATTAKTIRLPSDVLERIEVLLPHFPECGSEAELLRQACIVGIYILAAQAPTHGGYSEAELVGLLRYRVMPAIDFLGKHNALPLSYGISMAQLVTNDLGSHVEPPEDADTMAGAASELEQLGSAFMD